MSFNEELKFDENSLKRINYITKLGGQLNAMTVL